MANVVVSYSRHSKVVAGKLVEDVRKLGHTVWFDRELSGGQVWWDQILTRIRGAGVFLLVLDSATLASTACRREYTYADALGKPVLPVLVSGSSRPEPGRTAQSGRIASKTESAREATQSVPERLSVAEQRAESPAAWKVSFGGDSPENRGVACCQRQGGWLGTKSLAVRR